MSYEPECLAGFDEHGDVVTYDGRKVVLPRRTAWAVANLLRPPKGGRWSYVIEPHPHTRQDSEYDRQRRRA